jgi:hypothetical protein
LAENVAEPTAGWLAGGVGGWLSATEDLAEDVSQPAAGSLTGTLTRRLAGRLSTAEDLAQNVAEPAAGARARLAAGVRVLRECAHDHRGDDREHLLQNRAVDAGAFRRLRGDAAAHLLRAEDVAENRVAVGGDVLVVLVEVAGVLAACERADQAGKAVGGLGLPPQPGHHDRRQFFDGSAALALVQAELPAERGIALAALAFADQV